MNDRSSQNLRPPVKAEAEESVLARKLREALAAKKAERQEAAG